MDVPPEFLIKLEKSTAGSNFGCLPLPGAGDSSMVALTLPYRQPVVSSAHPHVPAVYLAHAFLAIVAILAVRGMNKLRVPNGPVVRSPPPLLNLQCFDGFPAS